MEIRGGIPVRSNVKIIIRERGKIVGRRESANIVVLSGRAFLRDRNCVRSYPPIPTVPGTGEYPFAQYPGDGTWPLEDLVNPYVLRYCAFGSGGILNGGAYTEHQNIGGLEKPLPVAPAGIPDYEYRYVVQALPQPDPADPYIFPSATEVCYRFVVQKNELSLPDTVTISEILALTSQAHPYKAPTVDTYNGQTVPGAAAYNIFEPFPKTSDHIFEVLWYWRW